MLCLFLWCASRTGPTPLGGPSWACLSHTRSYPTAAGRNSVIPIVTGVWVVVLTEFDSANSSVMSESPVSDGVNIWRHWMMSTQKASILKCIYTVLVHKWPSYYDRRICVLCGLLLVLSCRDCCVAGGCPAGPSVFRMPCRPRPSGWCLAWAGADLGRC